MTSHMFCEPSVPLPVLSDISPPSIHHIPADHEPDKQLTDWLKEQGADPDTIDKVQYLYVTAHWCSTSAHQHCDSEVIKTKSVSVCLLVCAGRIHTDGRS